jgi:DMSO/TMAO reductase YedYZ molybdopterin-dependent catalytic subunit
MNNQYQGRRGFIKKSILTTFGLLIGSKIVHGNNLPLGYLPIYFGGNNPIPEGKHPELKILNDRPWNIETPAHLLDDDITPEDKLFVRNNGKLPEVIDVKNWTLNIWGESVTRPRTYTLEELKQRFKVYRYQMVLECAGNGRSAFNPTVQGIPWGNGAVGCPVWTGIRLRDVLQDTGLKSDAVYIGYEGKDIHLSGNIDQRPISRGVPIHKALEDQTLLAWAMNGKDIPLLHGYPLRLVVGGWAASVSGKWLSDIMVRNKIHDGQKMKPPSYSMPCETIAPGEKVPLEKMCIIEELPVKSIITWPKTGGILKKRRNLEIRGHAWSGTGTIKKVELSIDFGIHWQECELTREANLYSWAHWKTLLHFNSNGYYEIWARATDTSGNVQPLLSPSWNPKGYYNNACHKIAIKVEKP